MPRTARTPRSRIRRLVRFRGRRFRRRALAFLALWHHWLPSWGTSVLIHAIALLVLGLMYLGTTGARRPPDFVGSIDGDRTILGEAIDSVAPGETAGDPFTTSTSADFPSIRLGPSEPSVRIYSAPAPPAGLKFAATLSPPRVSALPGMRLSDSAGARYHVEDMTAPFAGRDPTNRATLIRREGGSVDSEKAVQAGLDWLARHQRADGAWTLDYHPECSDPPCPDESPPGSDTAATGLGLLPMLGAGHIHTKPSRYSDNVQRGLNYLISRQGPEGGLYLGGGVNYRFYSHAIASMALCEAYGLSKDPRLREPAQRAIFYIAKSQTLDDGGWRYFVGDAGDTSVLGWQVFALRSARLAGLDVPRRTVQGCRQFLDAVAADPAKSTYGYMVGRDPTPVMTAEALLCRQYLGWSGEVPALRKGAGIVYNHLRESNDRNIYYWYYATQLLHNLGGKEWVAWNKHVRDGLVGMQVRGGGCDRGSWDPIRPQPDRWGLRAGRLYLTSLSILTLEVYYRWLPLYRPTEEAVDPKPRAKAPRTGH